MQSPMTPADVLSLARDRVAARRGEAAASADGLPADDETRVALADCEAVLVRLALALASAVPIDETGPHE